jgi:hypothetical protein
MSVTFCCWQLKILKFCNRSFQQIQDEKQQYQNTEPSFITYMSTIWDLPYLPGVLQEAHFTSYKMKVIPHKLASFGSNNISAKIYVRPI